MTASMPSIQFPQATKPSTSHAGRQSILSDRMDCTCISSLEKLEQRLTLSVTVKAVNGSILISGDSANDRVSIIEDGGGNLFIYGDVNTSISGDGVVAAVIPDTNAGGGREFNNGLFSHLFINLGDGNDSLEIAGLRSTDVQSLTINTAMPQPATRCVFTNDLHRQPGHQLGLKFRFPIGPHYHQATGRTSHRLATCRQPCFPSGRVRAPTRSAWRKSWA
jgi:hypothetical protein